MGPQVVFHSRLDADRAPARHGGSSADDIDDGDMFVVNDPYYGAVHHPTSRSSRRSSTSGRLLAWAGVAAHQVDMGGMSVGSISARAREKQQEGLMMPPIEADRGRASCVATSGG